MTQELEWRVIAGPNIGASLSLTLGRQVVGSGDAADMILSDGSILPEHLEIEVSAKDGGGFVVRAIPLAGSVRLNGEKVPKEGVAVPPGKALTFGLTAIEYREKGADWADVELVPLSYAKALAPTETTAPAESSENELAPAAPVTTRDSAKDAEETPSLKPKKSKERKSFFGLLGLILALLALGFLAFMPSGADEGDLRLKGLKRLLADNGFGSLEVNPYGRGFEATGEIESDLELNRLVDLVKSQPAKVFLKISVRRDLLEAARQALISYGFYPAISVGEDGWPTVAVYMLNQAVEDKAFANLARDVPAFKPVKSVIHRAELEPVLSQSLVKANLGDLKPTFREGWLEMAAPPEFEGAKALAEAVKLAESRVGAPVVYSLKDEKDPEAKPPATPISAEFSPLEGLLGASTPKAEPIKADPLKADPNDPLSTIEVAGITLTPMRFVSARDGQRLFEGSPLPSGWVIAAIKAQSLTLTKDGETRVINLGGD
jgi:type III secretion system YscD/HrpQ family protein